jgi:hypothetical protein
MFLRHQPHQTFQRQRVVAGVEHVIGMVEVDFKLPREASATAPSAGISCKRASSSISFNTSAKWFRLSTE